MKHIKSIFILFLFLVAIVSSRAQGVYGMNEFNLGLSYTHSTYPVIPAIESGGGIIGYFHISFLQLLFFHNNESQFQIGDIVGGEAGVGKRTLNSGSFTDPLMSGDANGISPIWLDFGLDLGFQLHVNGDNFGYGIRYYFHGAIDGANSWIVDKTNNDFDLINLLGHYKRFMGEVSFTKNHSIFWHASTGAPNNSYHSASFKYLLLNKKKKGTTPFIGMQWNEYSNENTNVKFNSNNFRILYGWYM